MFTWPIPPQIYIYVRVGMFFPWSEKNTEISGKEKRGSEEMEKTHSVILASLYTSYIYIYLHVLQITVMTVG